MIQFSAAKMIIRTSIIAISLLFLTSCGEPDERVNCDVLAAKLLKALADLNSIEAGLQMYQLERGNLPNDLQELVPDILVRLNKDPWEIPYDYRLDESGRFILYSKGINLAYKDKSLKKKIKASSNVSLILEEAKSLRLCK